MKNFTLVKYKELVARAPDSEGQTAKVWHIRKDETIRINLVEMSGELKLHSHPDADHSLMLLEGRVKVQIGEEFLEIAKGDFISIPAGVPHKYWSLTPISMLVSMDAPYYDPEKTISLE
ncbi:MAG: cupin domain-containing protein [Bdellovibrionota bacterium]